jgi:hypothetical protein
MLDYEMPPGRGEWSCESMILSKEFPEVHVLNDLLKIYQRG